VGRAYARWEPELDVLDRVVQQHVETFVQSTGTGECTIHWYGLHLERCRPLGGRRSRLAAAHRANARTRLREDSFTFRRGGQEITRELAWHARC
jgi:hypothetical protein